MSVGTKDYVVLAHYLTPQQLQELKQSWDEDFDTDSEELEQISLALQLLGEED